MAKLLSGAQLIADARKRADVEGDDDRHPDDDVLRYLNLGRAERYDLMIAARGKPYFRSPSPWTFTTTSNTTLYTTGFPATFYQLISIRVSCADGRGPILLEQAPELEEALLLDTDSCGCWPAYYDLRPAGIGIYPRHSAGLLVTVEWIPCVADIANDDTLSDDGINGWEEYEVLFAAKRIALKDEEYQLAGVLTGEMKGIAARITSLTPKRDNFRPRRVQDSRGARMFGRLGGRGR